MYRTPFISPQLFWHSFLWPPLAQAPQMQLRPPAEPHAAESHANTVLKSPQNLAARGRLDKAMAQLDQLAAQNPEPAGVERLRGMILYQKEQFPQAIEAFTRAATQDPNDSQSIEMHGVSLFRMGRSNEALPLLEKAHTAVERANIDPQYVLGLCYADVKRYDDARHAFAAQYGFDADSAEAYLLAGRLFLRREFVAEAAIETRRHSKSIHRCLLRTSSWEK